MVRELETEGQVCCSFLLGEPEEPLRDKWHFPWPVQGAWDLDREEQKEKGFGGCEQEPAD